MTAIVTAYDLLRNISPNLYADREAMANELILGDEEADADARRLLVARLANLQKAIKKLKTTPANEGKEELTALVETLMPLAAYALSVPENPTPEHQALQARALEQLKPLFKQFEEIYANKYSPDALDKLARQGVTLSEEERIRGETVLAELNQICANNFNALEMRAFLLKLNAQEHPDLLDPMIEGLYKYRRENMGNFARDMENLDKALDQMITNQSVHSDYLQGPDKIGYMVGRLLLAFCETVLHMLILTPLGIKVPFNEDNDAQQNNGFRPIPNPDGGAPVMRRRM